MANELYAIEKGTNALLVWQNVTGIAYSNVVLHEGETYRHEFSDANCTAGTYFLYKVAAGAKSSPDSVMDTAPRKKSIQHSVITITVTGGETFIVIRDRIRGGCVTNVNPRSIAASGTTYYGQLRSGQLLAFASVSGVTEANENVYLGDTYSNEFSLSRATSAAGYVEDEAGVDKVPDSVSKTAPQYKEQSRSVFEIAVTAPASMTLKVFRDELAGLTLMNANPRSY